MRCWQINYCRCCKTMTLSGSHDYHLLPFAHELRKRGVNNRIGFLSAYSFPDAGNLQRAADIWHLAWTALWLWFAGFPDGENDRLAFLDCLSNLTASRHVAQKAIRPAWRFERSLPDRHWAERNSETGCRSTAAKTGATQSRTEKRTKYHFLSNDWIIQRFAGAFSSPMKRYWKNIRNITVKFVIPRSRQRRGDVQAYQGYSSSARKWSRTN